MFFYLPLTFNRNLRESEEFGAKAVGVSYLWPHCLGWLKPVLFLPVVFFIHSVPYYFSNFPVQMINYMVTYQEPWPKMGFPIGSIQLPPSPFFLSILCGPGLRYKVKKWNKNDTNLEEIYLPRDWWGKKFLTMLAN